MIMANDRGLTLVELLLAVTITGIIAGAGTALLSTCLEAQRQGEDRSRLYQEGLMAMERMTNSVRNTTYLFIPNGHDPTRAILAISDMTNDDGDFYFGDPLFPRIDEDPSAEIVNDAQAGIENMDDDGDGDIDDGAVTDDDEDQADGEDFLDGMDNDGDGNIDEDSGSDCDGNGYSGIKGFDDDGNGTVDDGSSADDDDEDSGTDEDDIFARIYEFDSGTNTLTESVPQTGMSNDLSSRVTAFTATYEPPDPTRDPRVLISLTLTDDDGDTLQFTEYVVPRNVLQKIGKRVR